MVLIPESFQSSSSNASRISTLLLGTPPAPEHVCDISGLMVIVFEMMDDDCFCSNDGVCDDNNAVTMIFVVVIMIVWQWCLR